MPTSQQVCILPPHNASSASYGLSQQGRGVERAHNRSPRAPLYQAVLKSIYRHYRPSVKAYGAFMKTSFTYCTGELENRINVAVSLCSDHAEYWLHWGTSHKAFGMTLIDGTH